MTEAVLALTPVLILGVVAVGVGMIVWGLRRSRSYTDDELDLLRKNGKSDDLAGRVMVIGFGSILLIALTTFMAVNPMPSEVARRQQQASP